MTDSTGYSLLKADGAASVVTKVLPSIVESDSGLESAHPFYSSATQINRVSQLHSNNDFRESISVTKTSNLHDYRPGFSTLTTTSHRPDTSPPGTPRTTNNSFGYCCDCFRGSKQSTTPLLGAPDEQRPLRSGFCGSESKQYHLRVAGPSMSGKTAFLCYLKHGQFTETQPTKDIEVGKIFWQGAPFVTWDSRKSNAADVKPACPTTPNIAHSLSKGSLIAAHHSMDALVYVVDASDPGRLKIAGRDFDRFLKRYHKVPVVLVIGAKRDKQDSVDHNEIRSQLRLLETTYDRECAVCLVSNVTGEGIDEAMEWVYNKVRQREGLTDWDPFNCCRYSRLES